MKTILVPTDFSVNADYALKFAVQLSKETGAEINLVHFLEIPTTVDAGYYLNYQVIQELTISAESNLQRVADQHQDCQISNFIIPSNPTDSISSSIKVFDADLIVIGSKKENSIRNLILGSTTQSLIRSIDCPVLSIARGTDLYSIKNAIIPIDQDTVNLNYCKRLNELSQLLNIEMHFVYINDRFDSNFRIESELSSCNFVKKYDIKTIQKKDIVKGILEYSGKVDADLIIMNTHGRSGLDRIFNGSITEELLQYCSIPTMVYHREGLN